MIRPLAPDDRASIQAILQSDDTFTTREVSVALELVDDALCNSDSDYWFRLAVADGTNRVPRVRGYICYGPTPMTDANYDLYWLATHGEARGQGVASALLRAMEADLRGRGARGIRVETSEMESYGAARKLYERHAYVEVARIPDFYQLGDALVTLYKQL